MEHNNSDVERNSNKRHIKMWVTDAVGMRNVHKMALSTTNRDIYFYDMSTPIYTPQFHLCGECCFCYNYNSFLWMRLRLLVLDFIMQTVGSIHVDVLCVWRVVCMQKAM